MLISFIRTMILYTILIVVIRLMGKRQLGEMEPMEFVVTMLLANLAAVPMQETGIPLLSGLIPILVVLSMELLLSVLVYHSVGARRLLCGKPVILMENGRLLQENLKKTRITPDELTEFLRIEGKCYALMFNGNFYCIHGNDHEVSCNGLLFHGSSHVLTFVLSEDERRKIDTLTRIMQEEFLSTDHLQDEMLRVLLKRFIILCTRIAEDRQGAVRENSLQFETIRKFYVLVDTYFKEKKQVQEYADMLNKSPKTLANILSAYQQPSAIRIIHNRIQAEARRLLLYTAKSSKEIALMLGFEDQAAFSRFFKNAAGLSATEYRHQYKK